MKELIKRIKSGVWVAGASFLVTVVGLILQNIGVFNLTPTEAVIATALGTALVSQITKYLNKQNASPQVEVS